MSRGATLKKVDRVRIGEATVTLARDGYFRLDGGAMFGIVPRLVWEQRCPPDAQHRIGMAFNGMLVEVAGRRVLIDPGLGARYDARFAERFAVEQPPTVLEELAAIGVGPEQIDVVIATHLHWDHAGAFTRLEGTRVVPTFPRAMHVVQRRQWEDASNPHERNRASYRQDDFEPVMAAGLVRLMDGDAEVAPGVWVHEVGGHAAGMQLVRVESGGETFLHLADLVPMRHHVQYPWIMGYDLYPVETLAQKKVWLTRAIEGKWIVGLVHDPEAPFGRIELKDGRPALVPLGAVGA
ncbi:MAG TPA: MBL fold metallo-hydrolase [Chloroflexota bacterium]|nr:MBL fold metallo-hydrolase [Chloroflexota bacterium]